jgi:hypothetical protein
MDVTALCKERAVRLKVGFEWQVSATVEPPPRSTKRSTNRFLSSQPVPVDDIRHAIINGSSLVDNNNSRAALVRICGYCGCQPNPSSLVQAR